MPSRRQYHLHRTLGLYVFVSLLVAVGAFNSNNNLLFWLFGLSLGLLLISGVISGAMLMGLRARRMPLEPTRVGGALVVRYELTNVNRLVPVFAVRLVERAGGEGGAEAGRGSAAGAAIGEIGGVRIEAFAAHVGPRQTVVIEARIPAKSRGRVTLSGFDAFTEFPFGIVRKSLRFKQTGSALVWPESSAEGAALLEQGRAQRGRFAPEPESLARAGVGDEFFALRPYREGDSLRSVAWKASARTPPTPPAAGRGAGGLLVRETAATNPLVRRVELCLDLRGARDKLGYERAVSAAAGVIEAAVQQRMLVSLRTRHADRPDHPTPARGGDRHRVTLLTDLTLLPAFEAGAQGGAAPPRPPAPDPAAAMEDRRQTLRVLVHAAGPSAGTDWAGAMVFDASKTPTASADAQRGES